MEHHKKSQGRTTRALTLAVATALMVVTAGVTSTPASATDVGWPSNASLNLDLASNYTAWPYPLPSAEAVMAAAYSRPWNGQRADGSRVRIFLLDDGTLPHPYAGTPVAGEYPILLGSGYSVPGLSTTTPDACMIGTHGEKMLQSIYAVAPGALVIPVQAGDCSGGSLTWSAVDTALAWIIAHASAGDVVSVSLSLMMYSASRLNQLAAAGVFVAVAGNNTDGADLCTNGEGDGTVATTRAQWESLQAVVVGGVQTGWDRPEGAGNCTEISAPEEDTYGGGQSSATAHTAAVAAAYWSGNPSLTAAQITTAVLSGDLSRSGGVDTQFFVRNSIGQQAIPAERRLTMASPPSGPVISSLTQMSATSATVTWTPPLLSSAPITGYTATIDGAPATGCTNLAASVRTCTITGLAAGDHALALTASNRFGVGVKAGFIDNPTRTSSGQTVQIPGAVLGISAPPSAVPSVTATATVGGASLSWAAPPTTPSAPITGYEVWTGSTRVASLSSTATSTTITGLTGGTPVTLSIKALNIAGAGTLTAFPTITPLSSSGGGSGNSGGAPSNSGSGSSGSSSSTSGGAGGGSTHAIQSVRAASGPLGGGNTVALVGFGFTTTRQVLIGGKPAAFTVINDAHIDVIMPSGKTTGAVDVQVILAPEVGSILAPGGYTYTDVDPGASNGGSTNTPPATPATPAVTPTNVQVVKVGSTRSVRVTATAGSTLEIRVSVNGKKPITTTVKATGKPQKLRLPAKATRVTVSVNGRTITRRVA